MSLERVSFVRDDRTILAPLDWTVHADERWLVLGANGSGKTTLVRITAMYEHPSSGEVAVLGERLGRTDVRVLRRRIGYSSAAIAAQIRPQLTAAEVVMTAKFAALEPWWHRYDDDDRSGRSTASIVCARRPSPTARSPPCRRANSSGCCSPAR
ncbi:MAG: ATP-binding cassette domain-containing protein [Ilumatobacteraceae bacterium]